MVSIPEHHSFIQEARDRSKRRRLNLDLPSSAKVSEPAEQAAPSLNGLNALQQRKRLAYGPAYSTEEELHTDLSQEYVNTGRRPQNFVLNASLEQRFKEFVAAFMLGSTPLCKVAE